MKRTLIGGGEPFQRYRVWGCCDENGLCEVLEKLRELEVDHPGLVADMVGRLRRTLPEEGPDFGDEDVFRRVFEDEVYEVKAHEFQEDDSYFGLRVTFFRDRSGDFACATAFTKVYSTPPDEVPRA